jgi:succinate dehydrogenase/fumarate reductase flavoprotein subunit
MAAKRVVVVGSGAAGVSAAVAAAKEGAAVVLLERHALLGGTTAYSGGGVWIPANPWAAAEGRPDTVDEALTYLANLGLGDSDATLAERYVRHGVRVLQATEAVTPLRWNTIPGFPDYQAELGGGKPGGGRSLEIDSLKVGTDILAEIRPDPYGAISPTSYFKLANRRELAAGMDADEIARRQREGITGKGVGLVAAMCLTGRQLGVVVRTSMRATKLITTDGAVTGVEAGDEHFEGQVIIASGGFERDPALVKAFLRGPMTAPASPPTNVGDGLRMGMTVGAALGNMSEAWWAPATAVPGQAIDGTQFYFQMLAPSGRANPGGIMVDRVGRRYANEAANYSDLGRSMQRFDASTYAFAAAPSWLIFDGLRRRSSALGPLLPSAPEPDWVVREQTIEQLAQRLGMDSRTLRETTERYNGHAARGVDEDFGRGSYAYDAFASGNLSVRDQLRPLSEPPFYAMPLQVGCLGTKGGLRIDGNAQVQRVDGSGPIPGLFAAGNAAANPFGCAYPSGGATIGPALVFGWLAGESAAAAST